MLNVINLEKSYARTKDYGWMVKLIKYYSGKDGKIVK